MVDLKTAVGGVFKSDLVRVDQLKDGLVDITWSVTYVA